MLTKIEVGKCYRCVCMVALTKKDCLYPCSCAFKVVKITIIMCSSLLLNMDAVAVGCLGLN